MIGEHKSVFSYLKRDFPEISLLRCTSHIIHLCSSEACLELPRSLEYLVKI
nr:unnamed protein product [Callosobruchus analis]